jgi:hypothetical protein
MSLSDNTGLKKSMQFCQLGVAVDIAPDAFNNSHIKYKLIIAKNVLQFILTMLIYNYIV